jgi:di/tricarboxylate transporter
LGHNIFIGWFLKALYILLVCVIIGIIILILGYDIYWILDYIDIKIIGAFLIGLFLSNAIHIIVDKI